MPSTLRVETRCKTAEPIKLPPSPRPEYTTRYLAATFGPQVLRPDVWLLHVIHKEASNRNLGARHKQKFQSLPAPGFLCRQTLHAGSRSLRDEVRPTQSPAVCKTKSRAPDRNSTMAKPRYGNFTDEACSTRYACNWSGCERRHLRRRHNVPSRSAAPNVRCDKRPQRIEGLREIQSARSRARRAKNCNIRIRRHLQQCHATCKYHQRAKKQWE